MNKDDFNLLNNKQLEAKAKYKKQQKINNKETNNLNPILNELKSNIETQSTNCEPDKSENIESNHQIEKSFNIITEMNKIKWYANNIFKDFIFEFDENNRQKIIDLIYCFNGIKGKYDLRKGICLIGNVGTGKSRLMQLFEIYCDRTVKKNIFTTVNMLEITSAYSMNGEIGINKYLGNNNNPKSYCFDDLGAENNGHYYGIPFDINSLFQRRYNLFTTINPNEKRLTHITSNLEYKHLTVQNELFDLRTVSRFTEMFNFIALTGNSKRGRNEKKIIYNTNTKIDIETKLITN
jgi:hypothetical protein